MNMEIGIKINNFSFSVVSRRDVILIESWGPMEAPEVSFEVRVDPTAPDAINVLIVKIFEVLDKALSAKPTESSQSLLGRAQHEAFGYDASKLNEFYNHGRNLK